MTHKFIIELTDVVKGYKNDVDYLERIYGAEEITDNEIYNQALEKQISKKVVHTHHCPSCDKGLPIKGITDDYCSECFNWNYCPNCGQALKWE